MAETDGLIEELRDLRASVQVLEAKQAITEVIYRYCRGVDRADEAMLRSCFHEDAYEDHAGLFVGNAMELCSEIVAGMGHMGTATHAMTNLLIEVDGDTATAESYLLSLVYVPAEHWGQDFDWLVSARFIHLFERRDGVWKILHRKVVSDWNQYFPHRDDWGKGAVPWPNNVFGTRDESDESYSPGVNRQGF
jgi:hypothetical protein